VGGKAATKVIQGERMFDLREAIPPGVRGNDLVDEAEIRG
jgi:hypothetical protein